MSEPIDDLAAPDAPLVASEGTASGEPARDRRYWRSVDRLLDSPAVQEQIASEFAPGALDPPNDLTRRSVLQIMAASFGLAGLAACRRPVEHIVPYVHPPEDFIPGVPLRYATALPYGTEALGVIVEAHEGRPTKVEGNPRHPASHGAANAWAQASVLGLYDPDRAAKVQQGSDVKDWAAFGTWWGERAKALAAGGGARLAVLAAPFASPTLARLARALLAKYPQSRWVTWDPLSEESIFTGHGGMRPVYHLDKAQAVLALDADLLLTEANAVHNAWAFAQARRPEQAGDTMLRLYAVESALTLTGANADHRLALRPRQVVAFLAAVARELGVASAGIEATALPGPIAARAVVVARDLKAAGAGAVVAAGRRHSAAVQALTLAINRALGSVGQAVTLAALDDVAWSPTSELQELVTAMNGGQVDTLVVLGGNPLYDAPADLDFASALARVPNSVTLSLYRHETGRATHWHVPETHPLEAWGDTRSADGTAAIGQPLIAPLLEGTSRVEMLGLLAEGTAKPGHDLVRETWTSLAADDAAWHKLLLDGVAPSVPASGGAVRHGRGAAPAPSAAAGAAPVGAGHIVAVAPGSAVAANPQLVHNVPGAPTPDRTALVGAAKNPAQAEAAQATAPTTAEANPPLETQGLGSPVTAKAAAATKAQGAEGGLDVVILTSPQVRDGAFANNAWLQELPHPLSKLTWDNAAYMAPATATDLGLTDGQRVLVVAGGNRIGVPVVVLPGTAERTVAIELGYGRRHLGRVADGVGGNAYLLRTTAALWGAEDAEVHRTWGEHTLANTQAHGEMEGRPVVREASLAEYRKNPHFAQEVGDEVESHHAPHLWEEPARWDESPQWSMAIDLASCIGCNACVMACQAENNIPVVGREQVHRGREMHWLRVDRYFTGELEDPAIVFQPIPCMHCENAPCEQVCPVAATVHDHNGLNVMVYNRCIGTRYCSNNCPYKVRHFNFFNYTKDTPELLKLAMNPDVTVRSRGVMEKCTYCVQRIVEARQGAKLAGRAVQDGEIQTACQQTCPTQAIVFGDKTDSKSAVMAKKGLPRDYTLLAELNNRPRTTYQAKVRNPNPEWT